MKRIAIFIFLLFVFQNIWAQFPTLGAVTQYVGDSIKHRPDKITANGLSKAYLGILQFVPDLVQDTASVTFPQHGWLRFQRKDSTAYIRDTIGYKRWRKLVLPVAGGIPTLDQVAGAGKTATTDISAKSLIATDNVNDSAFVYAPSSPYGWLITQRQFLKSFGLPVASFTPTNNNSSMVLDVFQRGIPTPFTVYQLLSWVDVCDSDMRVGNRKTNVARIAAAAGEIIIGGFPVNGAVAKSLGIYFAGIRKISGDSTHLNFSGTGTFSDTLTATTMGSSDSSDRVASTAWVKRHAFGGTETDATALAKTTTLTQGFGVSITGTATQPLSSNPSYILNADTSNLATRPRVQKAIDSVAALVGTIPATLVGSVQKATYDTLPYFPPWNPNLILFKAVKQTGGFGILHNRSVTDSTIWDDNQIDTTHSTNGVATWSEEKRIKDSLLAVIAALGGGGGSSTTAVLYEASYTNKDTMNYNGATTFTQYSTIIIYVDVLPVTNAQDVQARTTTDGTTFLTGTNYFDARGYATSSADGHDGNGGTTEWVIGHSASNTANTHCNVTMTIDNPNRSAQPHVTYTHFVNESTGALVSGFGSLVYNGTQIQAGIQIKMQSGNMAFCSIKVVGYK